MDFWIIGTTFFLDVMKATNPPPSPCVVTSSLGRPLCDIVTSRIYTSQMDDPKARPYNVLSYTYFWCSIIIANSIPVTEQLNKNKTHGRIVWNSWWNELNLVLWTGPIKDRPTYTALTDEKMVNFFTRFSSHWSAVFNDMHRLMLIQHYKTWRVHASLPMQRGEYQGRQSFSWPCMRGNLRHCSALLFIVIDNWSRTLWFVL